MEEFNNILHVANIGMMDHMRETSRLIHFHRGDMNTNFFEIFNVDIYSEAITKFNNQLEIIHVQFS